MPITIIKNEGLEIPLDEETADGIIADGSLFYYCEEDIIILLKSLNRCMKKSGKMWANWRSTSDSMNKCGIKLDKGLYKLNTNTGRDGCNYFFCDEETINVMYDKAGFIVVSIDEFIYTENDGKTKCSYYHVVSEKR